MEFMKLIFTIALTVVVGMMINAQSGEQAAAQFYITVVICNAWSAWMRDDGNNQH